MSRLSELVDAAANGSTALSALLRQVKVVATRIGAADLREWVDQELAGYDMAATLPAYRGTRQLPVRGTWSGPMGSQLQGQVSHVGLSEEFVTGLFFAAIRQPISELEMLASGSTDPGIAWDPWAVHHYDQVERGIGFEYMTLVEAHVVVPRSMLAGVLDGIRNQVLELALALEAASPDAGEPQGPTIADPAVQGVAHQFVVNVFGDGTNIALGSGSSATSTVIKGDLASLIAAARSVGLDQEAAQEFATAVETDGREDGPTTTGFLQRVKTGAVSVAGGVASNIVASLLLQAAMLYLGTG
ncbi:hypothetical protein GALL_233370 [mine drainage metagenome]|uniref:AbiTii domain-containing protein n=1 Tax=mine drainage metagenome TaxID=410659 RepID=A0A1J5RRS4_9ZZZZ